MKKALYLLPFIIIASACQHSEEAAGTTGADKSGAKGAETSAFATNVQPILNRSCVTCHGEGGKAGLDLRSYESVMQGGMKGPVVVAGDPEKSRLIQSLHGKGGIDQMPKNSAPLEDAEIKQISDWIQSGAKS